MGIDPGRVTAVLVTRGNVNLTPILRTLIFPHMVVWDNSERENLLTFGRYAAMSEAPTEVCYTQDDDVIVPPRTQRAMCRQYVDGLLNVNIEKERQSDGWPWVGWGALVQRELPELAFRAWSAAGQSTRTRAFRIVGCDIVSGLLTPSRRTSFAYRHLPYAFGKDRAYLSEGFGMAKLETQAAVAKIKPALKLNLGCGDRRLDGFVNLDKTTGWTFEQGLPYEDETVAAITVSHALMYVKIDDWPGVFAEMARVLEPDGVLRVTEDSTFDPKSERYDGHHDAVTLTDPLLVLMHMRSAGLEPYEPWKPMNTIYKDKSLIQEWHGDPPKVFHVEAGKP